MAKNKLRPADLEAAESPTDIRTAVKALRVALGLGQEGLARQLNVATRTVARWETPGETLPPSTLTRLRLFALNAGAIDAVAVFDAAINNAKITRDLFYGGDSGDAERQYTPQNVEELAVVIDALKHHRAGDIDCGRVGQSEPGLVQRILDEDPRELFQCRRNQGL